MLEDFVVPAAGAQMRSCALGDNLDGFCERLVDLGYKRPTIRYKLWVVSCFTRWMAREHVAVVDLDDVKADEFLDARRRRGRYCHGFRTTVLQLMDQLRSAGVVRTSQAHQAAHDGTPTAVLLARYEEYLRRERALAEVTITAYRPFVRDFVAEHFASGAARLDAARAQGIRDFLLARVRRMAPRRGQFMACALRSFLRFLFLRGETGVDLALAVPMVRQWHLSSLPRYMPAKDVEKLLRARARFSITGRRDHAILLLLARLGLRASEITALELGDLRWREGEVVVRGKGMVRDRLPLLPDVGKALALYIRKGRPPGSSRHVFLRRQAPYRGLSHSTVSRTVARALFRAGLAPTMRGAHLLRHSLATAMVRKGASLAEIGQVLRHRSPSTTEIYAKLDFDALRDVALPWPTCTTAGAQ